MIGFTLEEAFEKVGLPLYPQTILKECYNQPHRLYHNLDHLREMLRWVPKDHPEVEIVIDAILFHDIVHASKPSPKGVNEALSVAEYIIYNTKTLAFDNPFSRDGEGSLEYEKRVISAITATAFHTEDQKYLNEVSKLVLDLDLSTFALPWNEYLIWKDKIEQENAIIWKDFAPENIKRGRGIFLQTLLKREKLYYIKTEWEQQARDNINKDIEYCVYKNTLFLNSFK